MSLYTVEISLKSVCPVLFHNPQLADPMNQYAKAIKAITAKKNRKTDDDLRELAKLEFEGGLYLAKFDRNLQPSEAGSLRPCVPGELIEGVITSGAKRVRRGQDAKSSVFCVGDFPLLYKGPTDPDKLFEDKRFVDSRMATVQRGKVIRVRPRFDDWELKCEIKLDPEVVNPRDVEAWITEGGSKSGIGDYRPRYGRFTVTSFKVMKSAA